MLKLYSVLLGGRAPRCNTELHDVIFVVGNSLEEAYPQLFQKWFGDTHRLHIDASVELRYVDGYEISLSKTKPEPSAAAPTLFFINFGAYKPGFFGEIHETAFYVAPNKETAYDRAKKTLCVGLSEQHCDDNLAIVDDMIAIQSVDQYYLHLQPTQESCQLNIESYYRKLIKANITEPAI